MIAKIKQHRRTTVVIYPLGTPAIIPALIVSVLGLASDKGLGRVQESKTLQEEISLIASVKYESKHVFLGRDHNLNERHRRTTAATLTQPLPGASQTRSGSGLGLGSGAELGSG